jgi:uncharacterized protein
MFGGLLCTVDPLTDPIATYDALLAFNPPAIDFLLPHANHRTGTDAPAEAFANWLTQVFDRWYDAPGQHTRIRFFESIVDLVLGGTSRSEQVGLSPAAVAVIETDGAVEQTDALKTAYQGAAATGLSVLTDSFDDVLKHPGIIARQIGVLALSPQCLDCSLLRICGGGHYAHRYDARTGFVNPSVYCQDLKRLITHIYSRITVDLSVRLRSSGHTQGPR